MAAPVKQRLTAQQYLELERKAPYRSEFLHGEIFAMAGTSREHNLIAGNVLTELRSQLRGRPCEVYMSDIRVNVDATGLYTYPDVVALCGERQFQDAHIDTLLNPMLIVEVLSPSTEAYDRGEKFAHYRRLNSLQEYVLIAQDRVRIEHYARRGEQWVLTEVSDPAGVLELTSIGCRVPVELVYERIEFPESPPARGEPNGSSR